MADPLPSTTAAWCRTHQVPVVAVRVDSIYRCPLCDRDLIDAARASTSHPDPA